MISMQRRPVAALLASVSCLGLGLATPAFADEGAEALGETASSPSTSGDAIVVTATKRNDSMQDVPIAVSTVSDELLAQANISTVSGIQNMVPNLRFAPVSGTPQVYVRGVGGGGRNIGFTPRVGVYIDGVYMGDTAALDAVMVGVQSVEVLRGPQGFLFGAATDAGAINIATKAPDATPSVDASVAYGRWNDLQLTGRVNMPISEGVYMSVAGMRRTRDGYTLNVYNGEHPNDVDDYGVRARLRVEMTSDLTFDLSADYSRTKTHLLVGDLLTNAYGTAPSGLPAYTVNQKDPEFDVKKAGGVSASFKYAGAAVNLTSITAYRESYRQWVTDTDHVPDSIYTVDYRDKYRTFSQELTLASANSASPLSYLGGLYFSLASNSSDRTLFLGEDADIVGFEPNTSSTSMPTIDRRTASIYGSVDYDIVPELTLEAGARLEFLRQTLTASQEPLDGLGYASFVGYHKTINETNVMPMASLSYKPSQDLTLYAKYARGVKNGGFNVDFVYVGDPNSRPYEYNREKVDTYELGAKGSFLGRALTANLALFLNNFSDYQVFQYQSQNGFTSSRLSNAGKVQTYGVELETQAHLLDSLDLTFNVSRLVAKYKRFPDGGGIGVDYDGNRLEYAPKWNISTRVDYEQDVPIFNEGYVAMGADYSYRSDAYAEASNSPSYYMGSSSLLGARLGIGDHAAGPVSWQFTLSGENLLKSKTFTNVSIDGAGVLLGFREIPRRWMAKLELHY